MTASDVAELLRRCGQHNVWFDEEHLRKRLAQRRVSVHDVLEALRKHTKLEPQPKERWKVAGPDLDGDELIVIVAIEADIVIITVF